MNSLKISRVETILTNTGRNYLIVKIMTQSGIIGYGDATLNGRELAVQSVIDQYISNLLIGHDSDRIEDIWQMIFKGSYWRGGPVLMTALAGIDMALWDIKGKRANLPVYSLLGGKSRDKILTYLHIHGRNEKELVDNCLKQVKNGCRVIRYSFDSEDVFNKDNRLYQPHQDISMSRIEVKNVKKEQGYWNEEIYANSLIKITKKLRESLGDNIGLIHDVHGRLSLAQACRVVGEMEKYNLLFLEDPIDSMNKEGLRKLSNSSNVPIGIGELYNTIYDCKNAISNQLITYIRVDISHFGGITPLKKTANLSEVYGIKTAFHGPSDISPIAHAALAHVDLTISNFGVQETVDFSDKLTNDVFDSGIEFHKGFITISDEPGLGVTVNEELAREHKYEPSYLPILRDEMGAIHNW